MIFLFYSGRLQSKYVPLAGPSDKTAFSSDKIRNPANLASCRIISVRKFRKTHHFPRVFIPLRSRRTMLSDDGRPGRLPCRCKYD